MGQESLRRLGGRSKKASPPVLSHEFVIQNHGDIMSCIVMLIFGGFMFQVTSPLAALFVSPQYNFTVEESGVTLFRYTNGLRDLCTVVFYSVCAVVAHAVIQEYVLDKLQRRLHLSKTRTSKFTESGHLFAFAAYSVGHAVWVLQHEAWLPELSSLWAGYPQAHAAMPLSLKLYFLVQLAYWLHQFPEFYFQKAKKEEMRARTAYTLLYLLFIGAAYALNFTRVGLCMLTLHFASELIFHASRMAHFAEKTFISGPGFRLFNAVFVAARLGCVSLAVLVFWYGLRASEVHAVNLAEGNFNTTFIRLNCLLCVGGLQAWLMWNFITFQLKRLRSSGPARPKQSAHKAKAAQRKEKAAQRKMDQLPEADQEVSRVLRSAKKAQ